MKDKQTPTKPQHAAIPVISPVLHVVCMPVIVFLRRGFGYSYLRPKSVFLAIAWAFILYMIYAWHEVRIVGPNFFLIAFGALAVSLYFVHLLGAFVNQFTESPRHDNFAGKSWIHLILLRAFTKDQSFTVLWLEPVLAVGVGLFFRFMPGGYGLSRYLLLVGLLLWCKEAINRWHQIRKVKLHRDVIEDAEDQIGKASGGRRGEEASTGTTRKRRVQRQRHPSSDSGKSSRM